MVVGGMGNKTTKPSNLIGGPCSQVNIGFIVIAVLQGCRRHRAGHLQ